MYRAVVCLNFEGGGGGSKSNHEERNISKLLNEICSKFEQMWPNLIAKAKEGGLDVIQTYVFWNLHEPQQGQVIKLKLVYINL